MRSTAPFALALTLALAGCAPPPDAEDERDSAVPVGGIAQLHGQANHLERIAVPGAVLHVRLIDNLAADPVAATVAERSYPGLPGPPYAFTLPFEKSAVRDDGSYSLHASLRDAGGRIVFATDAGVDVDPFASESVAFRMIRAASEPVSAAAVEDWKCGGLDVATVQLDASLGVSVGERALQLAPANGAANGRFSDSQGNAFSNQSDPATLTLDGVEHACTRVRRDPAPTSPADGSAGPG